MSLFHRFAAKLPGSSPWVLYELIEIHQCGMGYLIDALSLGERTIERAVHDLVARGLCVLDGRNVFLAENWREIVEASLQTSSKSLANSAANLEQGLNTTGTSHVTDGVQAVRKPGTSRVTELTNTVQDADSESPSRAYGFDVSSSVVEVPKTKTTTSKPKNKTPENSKNEKTEVPKPPKPPDSPPKARVRNEMIDALACAYQKITSPEGLEFVTDKVFAACLIPAANLKKVGFVPSDVQKIADFVRVRDASWRTGPITPHTIALEAGAWKASLTATSPPDPPPKPRAAPKRFETAQETYDRLATAFGIGAETSPSSTQVNTVEVNSNDRTPALPG